MRWKCVWLCFLAFSFANVYDVQAILARNHVSSICSTWGREHFKTFDGDVYQFPGMCEYNLASDCHETYREFSVHLKREENDGNPTVSYVVVTINDLLFHLTSSRVTLNDLPIKMPYYNAGVQVEKNAVYIKLQSKVGITVMWNGDDAVMVEVDNDYANRTCGLCGDFNGISVYDEFIHNGRIINPVEFGNKHKVHRPNDDCEDPYEEEDNSLESVNVLDSCKEFVSLISTWLGTVFDDISMRGCIAQSECQCKSDKIYNSGDIHIFEASSFHILLQTSFGLQIQIQHVPVMQVYVSLDNSYKGKTRGLCGNYNMVLSDDMKTPQGIVEGTAATFCNSWKANVICADREERLDDPCSLSMENDKYTKSCPKSQTFSYKHQRCQLTCSSLSLQQQSCSSDFLPVDGCSCSEGLYLDENGICVPMAKCPCYHNEVYIKPGKSINIKNEHCVCTNGMLHCHSWQARSSICPSPKTFFNCSDAGTGELGVHCPQTCMNLDSDDCNKCGNKTVLENFGVITENVPCGSTGTTCSKTVRIQLGRTEIKLSKGKHEKEDLGYGTQIPYKIRTVGLYLVVESAIGLAVMWDRKTTVRILLEPQHSEKPIFDEEKQICVEECEGCFYNGSRYDDYEVIYNVTDNLGMCYYAICINSTVIYQNVSCPTTTVQPPTSTIATTPPVTTPTVPPTTPPTETPTTITIATTPATEPPTTTAESTTKTTATPTTPCHKTCKWSEYYDVHNPKFDKSDWETYENITNSGKEICKTRKEIDCRSVDFPDKDFSDFVGETGQVVSCDLEYGLICRREDQVRPPRKCFNYKISVCCEFDKSDWETYENITNSGKELCKTRTEIDCRSVDFPDKDFSDFVGETGQVVSCDLEYGLICRREDQFDKSDWETYENITNSGKELCKTRTEIDCRSVDFPDKDFSDFVGETGQVVSCDLEYGLICRREDQQVTAQQTQFTVHVVLQNSQHVKTRCLDPEGIPREFNERFDYKCQNCICEESTKTVSCKPKACPAPPVANCSGPGFVLVNQTNPSDQCCSAYVCQCQSKTCPVTDMNCPVGYKPDVSVPEGKCCPEHTCGELINSLLDLIKSIRYSEEAASFEHFCSCCKETRFSKRIVDLHCLNGDVVPYTYMHVEECSCNKTECIRAPGQSVRRRRSIMPV
ncbi:Mucin-2 [Channa argus]|uniref:Mucin-2 n=1 Tax=Channa argus TaxID=215402 RepID=A0A6G1PEK8_CHAAH|nr:Mucin-2 [Channa argus]